MGVGAEKEVIIEDIKEVTPHNCEGIHPRGGLSATQAAQLASHDREASQQKVDSGLIFSLSVTSHKEKAAIMVDGWKSNEKHLSW